MDNNREPSLIHHQTAEFEERNNFLYFLLGIIGTSQAIQAVPAERNDGFGRPRPAARQEPAAPSDDLRDLLV